MQAADTDTQQLPQKLHEGQAGARSDPTATSLAGHQSKASAAAAAKPGAGQKATAAQKSAAAGSSKPRDASQLGMGHGGGSHSNSKGTGSADAVKASLELGKASKSGGKTSAAGLDDPQGVQAQEASAQKSLLPKTGKKASSKVPPAERAANSRLTRSEARRQTQARRLEAAGGHRT